ncbi:MAG: adenylyl-sulfate kinase [Caldilineaceae bacterium]
MRHGLNGDLGFSPEDRKENIRRAAGSGQAGLRPRQPGAGQLHLALPIGRDFARTLLPEGRFFEIYVRCDLEVLKRRDPKGLYAKALIGEIKEFTGVSAPYEEPAQPDILLESDLQTVDEIVEQILARLLRLNVLSSI